jgi:hypothetical protein
MISQVREALANPNTDFPEYHNRGYDLAGFVWYQVWIKWLEGDTKKSHGGSGKPGQE